MLLGRQVRVYAEEEEGGNVAQSKCFEENIAQVNNTYWKSKMIILKGYQTEARDRE